MTSSPPETRRISDAEVRANLVEALRCAVPLHMAAIRTWPAARRRAYLPPGWAEAVGFGDAILFGGSWKRAVRVFDAYARGLAVLAYEPGGVSLFGAHWCASPHDGCPHARPSRPQVDIAAAAAEFRRLTAAYETLIDVKAAPGIPPAGIGDTYS